MTRDSQTDTIAQRLRIGTGFTDAERGWIVERLTPLWTRLRSYQDTTVHLELSVKGRKSADPLVTLTCGFDGQAGLVATSSKRDIDAALKEVREDLVRQIDDAKTRREPHSNHRRHEA